MEFVICAAVIVGSLVALKIRIDRRKKKEKEKAEPGLPTFYPVTDWESVVRRDREFLGDPRFEPEPPAVLTPSQVEYLNSLEPPPFEIEIHPNCRSALVPKPKVVFIEQPSEYPLMRIDAGDFYLN